MAIAPLTPSLTKGEYNMSKGDVKNPATDSRVNSNRQNQKNQNDKRGGHTTPENQYKEQN
jgi:hypothetical protein